MGAQIRAEVLKTAGADSEQTEELLAYNANSFPRAFASLKLPLGDELFVAFWRDYAHECELAGSVLPLSKYLVQLTFPIKEGISGTTEYLAATRRGTQTESHGNFWLQEPGNHRLLIHQTIAGAIPLLIISHRADFVLLVQALSYRNEPVPIPKSMGACVIAGYNNWHRVRVQRQQFETSIARPASGEEWQTFFSSSVIPRKELYQDRFILLSDGPYSGVPAPQMDMQEQQWRDLSLIIRREHECTHYFTRRVYGLMRNNLLDEIIADYIGISAACGRFRGDWLLRFLGLEEYPRYREGGRLQNYLGGTPLSVKAVVILYQLLYSAARNLERFDTLHRVDLTDGTARAALITALTGFTLEELAWQDAPSLLHEAWCTGRAVLAEKV